MTTGVDVRAVFVKNLTGGGSTGPWGVGGTDLGFPIRLADGRFGFFLGDTFESPAPSGPGWRSPVMLRSTTTDLDAGIVFSSAAGGTVYGAIFARWGQEGYENSRFGFPRSDEYPIPGGRQSDFQGGWIKWNESSGSTSTS